MNPVRAIRREVAGAWRSLRYDLRRKRSGSAAAPVAEPAAGRTRQRLVLVAAGLVLVALAGGGIFAMVAGLRALLDPGRAPAGLPAHAAPAPAASPTQRAVTQLVDPSRTPGAAPEPSRSTSAAPRRSKGPKPPIPTPAPVPTCSCTQPPHPSPSASGSPTPTAQPSPSAVSTPTPDPTPQDGTNPGTAP